MKKYIVFCLFSFLFLCNSSVTNADIAEYPFDSITILSAVTFQVNIEEEPDAESILYNNVQAGETLTVYIGRLQYVYNGVVGSGSDEIIILTNESNEDFVSWLVNSSQSDITTYQQKSFGSWILIDPEIGVIKDDSVVEMEVGYYQDITNNTYSFVDDLDNSYPMIANSYQEEFDLNIQISAYVEEVE